MGTGNNDSGMKYIELALNDQNQILLSLYFKAHHGLQQWFGVDKDIIAQC